MSEQSWPKEPWDDDMLFTATAFQRAIACVNACTEIEELTGRNLKAELAAKDARIAELQACIARLPHEMGCLQSWRGDTKGCNCAKQSSAEASLPREE